MGAVLDVARGAGLAQERLEGESEGRSRAVAGLDCSGILEWARGESYALSGQRQRACEPSLSLCRLYRGTATVTALRSFLEGRAEDRGELLASLAELVSEYDSELTQQLTAKLSR
jgi:hypothetical protein